MWSNFDNIVDEKDLICPEVQVLLAIRPCVDSGQHGDDCYSVFQAGTDFCVFAHITFAQAFYHVYGQWPNEEENDEG